MTHNSLVAIVSTEFCRVKCGGELTAPDWLRGCRGLFGYQGEVIHGPCDVVIGYTQSVGGDSTSWTHSLPAHRTLVHVEAWDAPHLLCYAEIDFARLCEAMEGRANGEKVDLCSYVNALQVS